MSKYDKTWAQINKPTIRKRLIQGWRLEWATFKSEMITVGTIIRYLDWSLRWWMIGFRLNLECAANRFGGVSPVNVGQLLFMAGILVLPFLWLIV